MHAGVVDAPPAVAVAFPVVAVAAACPGVAVVSLAVVVVHHGVAVADSIAAAQARAAVVPVWAVPIVTLPIAAAYAIQTEIPPRNDDRPNKVSVAGSRQVISSPVVAVKEGVLLPEIYKPVAVVIPDVLPTESNRRAVTKLSSSVRNGRPTDRAPLNNDGRIDRLLQNNGSLTGKHLPRTDRAVDRTQLISDVMMHVSSRKTGRIIAERRARTGRTTVKTFLMTTAVMAATTVGADIIITIMMTG